MILILRALTLKNKWNVLMMNQKKMNFKASKRTWKTKMKLKIIRIAHLAGRTISILIF